jgi:hypothetical protein
MRFIISKDQTSISKIGLIQNRFKGLFSTISVPTFVVPAPTKAHCKPTFTKQIVKGLINVSLVEFGAAFKPLVNSGTLRTECYSWFLLYPILVCVLTTDTIRWMVQTGTSVHIPAFLAAMLSKCKETNFSNQESGVFVGSIVVDGAVELLAMIKSFTKDDVIEACDGTFLAGWSLNCDIRIIQGLIDSMSIHSNSHSDRSGLYGVFNYSKLFSIVSILFLAIRDTSHPCLEVTFDSISDQSLSIYRFRDDVDTGSYLCQSKGLASLSESTSSMEVILLVILQASFSFIAKDGTYYPQHRLAMPGDVRVMCGDIPQRSVFNSLFSITMEESSVSSRSRTVGNSKPLRSAARNGLTGNFADDNMSNTRQFSALTSGSIGSFYFKRPMSIKFTGDGLVLITGFPNNSKRVLCITL